MSVPFIARLFPRVPFVVRTVTISITATGTGFDAHCTDFDRNGVGPDLTYPNHQSESEALKGVLKWLLER